MGRYGSLIVLACSGPGAGATIQVSITIGYFCAAIGGVITAALAYDSLRTQRWRFALPIAAFMLLIHPAWTVSAVHGDCGSLKRDVSYAFTAIYFGLMVLQCFSWKHRRESQLVTSDFSPEKFEPRRQIHDGGVDENPYKSPAESAAGESGMFLGWPTLIEWVVIVIIAFVALMLFLPDLDEGRQAARERLGKQLRLDAEQQAESQ
jgi:hypothetical protein